MYNSQFLFTFIGKISEAHYFTSKFTGNIIDPEEGRGKGYPFCHWHFLPFSNISPPVSFALNSDPHGYFSTVGNLVSSFKMISLYEQLTDIDQSTTIPVYIYIYICTFEIFMISSLFIGMQRDNFRFI